MTPEATNTEKPLNPCDLVLVGGITSGIVYPAAIAELKNTYRFRRIGGTSAGAIAASGTAAAEFYRQKVGVEAEAKQDEHGFNALSKLSKTFTAQGFLQQIFKPPKAIRPLMGTILDLMKPEKSQSKFDPGIIGTLMPTLPPSFLQFISRLIPILRSNDPDTFDKGEQIGTRWGILIGTLLALPLSLSVLALANLFFELTQLQNILFFIPCLMICIIIGIILGMYYGAILGGPLKALFNLVRIVLVEVPGKKDKDESGNYYGLCIGHDFEQDSTQSDPSAIPPLTDWLHATYNKLAGLEGPRDVLTFRMLKCPGGCSNDKEIDSNGITLQMVTTNLSHGQPYTLPAGLKGFLFNEDQMHIFFPQAIVEHLKTCAAPSIDIRISADDAANIKQDTTLTITDSQLPPGFHFLPDPDDLPVVLATRLSLSLPILLSAVPLYTINYQAVENLYNHPQEMLKEEDLQVNWFSDGGLSSNFPIHFFDAWLPACPTFGINFTGMSADSFEQSKEVTEPGKEPQRLFVKKRTLTALPQIRGSLVPSTGAETDESNTGTVKSQTRTEDVYLPKAEDQLRPDWQDISGKNYFPFLSAIFFSGINYRDNMQAMLPSYRDRVVQIRFKQDEGGLNLNMTPDMIAKLVQKGSDAGQTLRDDFDFDAHRWVRFQVLMALLEKNLETMEATLNREDDIKILLAPRTSPYGRSSDWCQEAHDRVKELVDTIQAWQKADETWPNKPLFYNGAPEPIPVLRVTSEL